MPAPNHQPAGFQWPPRPPDAPGPNHAEPLHPMPVDGAAPACRPSPWRAFEREILGLLDAPPAERLAEAGWVADAPDRYCSRCGASTGPHEATPAMALEDLVFAEGYDATGGASCPECRDRRLAWHRAVRLGEYEGLLRELIHELKFEGRRSAGVELGRRLGRAVREAMTCCGLEPSHAVVVPVPMSFRRRWSRGVDHARVLARGVAFELGCPLRSVLRRQHRPTQWTVPASRRRANVRGAFRACPMGVARLKGRIVVVIDDVRTTGATLTECCSTIIRAMGERRPEAVWVGVVGVTPHGHRGGP